MTAITIAYLVINGIMAVWTAKKNEFIPEVFFWILAAGLPLYFGFKILDRWN